jgi:hypothetical protein
MDLAVSLNSTKVSDDSDIDSDIDSGDDSDIIDIDIDDDSCIIYKYTSIQINTICSRFSI